MKALLGLLAAIAAGLCLTNADAQSATTSGNSGTTCTQSGSSLVCTTTTTLTLPSGTNLNGMSLPQSTVTAPSCTALTATPSTLSAGVQTTVNLAVVGCPTSSSYTYAWASPIAQVNAATATYPITLTNSNPSVTFSVQVCFASNPSACSSYTATISVQATIPALSSCSISPTTSSVTVGATPVLSASCATGTGAGSGVSYQWFKNGVAIAGAVGSSYTLSASIDTAVAGTNSYSVQISNALPSTLPAGASVTVTPAVSGTTDGCPGTPVRLTINAAEPYRKIYTSDYTSSLSAGANFVVQFQVSANDTTAGRFLAQLGFVDFGAVRGGRYVTFSQNKCDYTDAAQWVSPNYSGFKTAVNAGTVSVVLGSDARSADVRLTPGTWYLNVQNVVGSCPSNVSCHVAIEWAN